MLTTSSSHIQYGNNNHRGNDAIAQKVNFGGDNLKSLMLSVETSLKRLRTTYIDLLYVHLWDGITDVEEIMDGLHNLVAAGKVLYLVRPPLPLLLPLPSLPSLAPSLPSPSPLPISSLLSLGR